VSLKQLPLDAILLADNNPRKTFVQESLEELAISIQERGVLVPVIVRPTSDGRYELIAGERRVRASRIAGAIEIPAIIREVSDDEAAIDALLENVQREDMNPIDKARGVKELLARLPMEQVTRSLGISETTVRRLLELLDLPPLLQRELIPRPGSDTPLSEGHARVLLGFNSDPETQKQLLEKIKNEKLGVGAAESVAKAIKEFPDRKEIFLTAAGQASGEMTRSLRESVGATAAKARRSQTAGEHLKTIDKFGQGFLDALDPEIIPFLSSEEMNRLLALMTRLCRNSEVFTHKLRQALDKEEFGFREVYTHCPLCGRVELIGANKCSACWTILRRCSDCGHFDAESKRCAAHKVPIPDEEASAPTEASKSFKCQEYRPRYQPKGTPLPVADTGGRRI
jgi:ParB family transcriptional regulator, chromosome partitioning protein